MLSHLASNFYKMNHVLNIEQLGYLAKLFPIIWNLDVSNRALL